MIWCALALTANFQKFQRLLEIAEDLKSNQ
jgi:hypothetical protein